LVRNEAEAGESVARATNPEKMIQQRRSLADRAFEEIEEMIVGGRLAPGALVSESELSRFLRWGAPQFARR
jgi:DNA-binding GntR family transcriptional regulator